MQKIITKKDLENKIKELLKDFEIIGPRQISNKGIFYQSIMNPEDLYLGDGFAIEPIKKFFLNPSEWLFKEGFKEGSDILEDLPLKEFKRIIIGVRPCEVRGLTLLDRVFDSDYKDNSYINNRKRTIIIGLACASPDRTCFCTSMGGSPVESHGMDALMFESEDGFTIEIITEKGRALFASSGDNLNEDKKKLWEQEEEKIKNSIKRKKKIPESLDKIFEDDYWDAVSKPCLSCGVCTYLCPTCHCFDLVDEERKRLRCYDGCAFADFTLQASGENPRPTKKRALSPAGLS